jgi:hypothetical protein
MCGICGEIRFDGRPVDPYSAHVMNDRNVRAELEASHGYEWVHIDSLIV